MIGIFVASVIASAAPSGGIGLGFMVGDPTALNVKFWQGTGISPVLAVGVDGSRWDFHGDINLHYPITAQSVNFLFYFGAGLKAEEKPDDEMVFGPRIPIGFELLLYEIPLDFFVEFAPSWEFGSDHHDFEPEGGIGMRVTIR